MDLEKEISSFLYRAIKEKYESGLYRDAILAATYYLQDCIRIKTNLEIEQVAAMQLGFINLAFGSTNPVIKINSMATIAEVYEQKGFEQLLLGLFQGIRYPRVHAECFDDEKTANAIIFFIDYLLHQIELTSA